MSEKQKILGPAKPLEEFDPIRESNLSYMSFSTHMLYKVIVTLAFLLVFSVGVNFYFFLTQKDVRIIGLTPDLRVIDLVPLNHALVSDAGLLTWFMQTISDTFSFTYNDWKDRMAAMQYRYTPDAFSSILNGFYRYIEEIAEKRQIINTVFLRIPRITRKGVDRRSGKYTWNVEGYANIAIEGGQHLLGQRVLIKVVIERVNPAIVPTGVIIKSVVFSPVS